MLNRPGASANAIAQFKKYHTLKISPSYTNPYQTTAILKTFINRTDRNNQLAAFSGHRCQGQGNAKGSLGGIT
jgi:hypothetical protein